ncbi:MAG: hypothetical protein H0V12_09300 [Chloroflexi bacterium]|nr:hypothetical protein [Chloroflexota bacterium]
MERKDDRADEAMSKPGTDAAVGQPRDGLSESPGTRSVGPDQEGYRTDTGPERDLATPGFDSETGGVGGLKSDLQGDVQAMETGAAGEKMGDFGGMEGAEAFRATGWSPDQVAPAPRDLLSAEQPEIEASKGMSSGASFDTDDDFDGPSTLMSFGEAGDTSDVLYREGAIETADLSDIADRSMDPDADPAIDL